jgi:DNA mismatch repair protein MutL
MPIQVLPENLVNQIAAGEVIVRPASAVKELVENSLDAGATMISVHLADGGRELRITDDGCGMAPEDAALALVRHATSKITQFDDLYRLTTRGFRGEALASIAAVARVRLLTRQPQELAGTLVTSEGGSPPEIRPAGSPPGTDIHVRDLFFNTPARLKFLKTPASETTAILAILTRLAIARPGIGFRVTGDSTTYLDLPKNQSWPRRIATLLGIPDQTGALLPVELERQGVRLQGYVAPPSLSGKDRRRQHFLLDGRPISSRTLSQVLQEAYRGVMMVGRFPWAVLDIRVPEGEVDINVHPSKEEVRFRRESLVTGALYRAVQTALRAAHIVPEADLSTSQPSPPSSAPSTEPWIMLPGETAPSPPFTSPRATQPEMLPWPEPLPKSASPFTPPIDLRSEVRATAPHFPDAHPSAPPVTPPAPWEVLTGRENSRPVSPAPSEPPPAHEPPTDLPSSPTSALFAPTASQSQPPPIPTPGPPLDTQEDAVFRWLHESGQAPQPLGQIADCYIIARAGETLLLIDQHAAHERILYARLSATTHPVPAQPLLIPLTLEAPPELVPSLHQALPLLAWFGFETSHFGGQTFIVQSTPSDLLPRLDPLGLLRDLLSDLSSAEHRSQPHELDQLRDRIVTRMSCRSAIKAGQSLHREEMAALLRDLAQTPLGTNCPHGRPTMITLTRHHLDKLFKRIV